MYRNPFPQDDSKQKPNYPYQTKTSSITYSYDASSPSSSLPSSSSMSTQFNPPLVNSLYPNPPVKSQLQPLQQTQPQSQQPFQPIQSAFVSKQASLSSQSQILQPQQTSNNPVYTSAATKFPPPAFSTITTSNSLPVYPSKSSQSNVSTISSPTSFPSFSTPTTATFQTFQPTIQSQTSPYALPNTATTNINPLSQSSLAQSSLPQSSLPSSNYGYAYPQKQNSSQLIDQPRPQFFNPETGNYEDDLGQATENLANFNWNQESVPYYAPENTSTVTASSLAPNTLPSTTKLPSLSVPYPSSTISNPYPSSSNPNPYPYPSPSPSPPNSYSSSLSSPSLSSPSLSSSSPASSLPTYVKPCHPTYMCLCVNGFPVNQSAKIRSSLTMGLVIQPLANAPPGEEELPVINFGNAGVQRCRICRAYINPYVQFIDGGQRWKCNFCNRENEVSSEYFAPFNTLNQRSDLDSKKELTHASFEIVASQEYTVRPPMPPVFLFVIDVSTASIKSGVLKTAAEIILQNLDKFSGDKRTRVGFITFNSCVHLYGIKSNSNTPSMYVLPDLEDIFLPVPNDLLVTLDECRSQVEALLKSLPAMHEKNDDVESGLGGALEAAFHVIARLGGKILMFSAGLPSIGPGRLQNRENPRVLGTEKEHEILQPVDDFYKKRAIKWTKYQITVDCFFFPHEYMDVSTIAQISKFSGGQVYYYPGFSAQNSEFVQKFHADLTRNLTRVHGWEAVIRVRVSQGIKLTAFYGHFFLRGSDLLALPTCDSDKSYAVEATNEDQPISSAFVSFQCALLYTTSNGERRIRVHTVCVPVFNSYPELYPLSNVNAMTNLITKQAMEIALSQSFTKAREIIKSKCISIIRHYRQSQGQKQQSSQLEALPLMILGLLKSTAFKEGSDVRSDLRAATFFQLANAGMIETETFLRPRLIPVHNLTNTQGLIDSKSGIIELPPELPLSVESLHDPAGAYLLDNGYTFYLRLGKQISSQFLMDIFGKNQTDSKQLKLRELGENDRKSSSGLYRLTNIINYLRSITSTHQFLHIIKEGDPSEVLFLNLLIEDRSMNVPSLVEFTQILYQPSSHNTF